MKKSKLTEKPSHIHDISNEDHLKLASLGEECTKKVSKLLSKGTATKTSTELVSASIGNLRKMIKAELSVEIKEIDGIVRGILKI